ncbi:MAG TPA: dihydroorotate dehydrogenase-like protein [Planctomycetaceae bacterium]|nr:dihydroorotate dehydrogenase-like protein [Planctomycetaceae bacterium]HQZ66693.1 dihydroorotate dehydrogenase-like protein [Planctomycetaceae bacterium]HRA87074.1 dihydroorotate dehydrogenase-like protein [Planctomycetaceae bacterium]
MDHEPNLSTEYLGIKLKNPIIASASPSNAKMDMLQRLEAAGIAAVVMPSLFEEQVEFEEWQFASLQDYGGESFAEAASYFPEMDNYNTGPDEYLRTIEKACETVNLPIIGSLNGVTKGGWTRYAKRIESAGAWALELNMYYLPTDASITAEQVENNYLELVAEVKSHVKIPVAVKIGPYFSSLANFAKRLSEAGADGLILFNRFMQPDFNLETMQVDARIDLSHSSEVRLPLRWVAILRGQVQASLAATSGIHDHRDVVKLLMAGADATMITSSILRHGPEFVKKTLDDLKAWLKEHGYRSVSQFKGGMSYKNCPDAAAIERSNYMKALTSYTGPYV